MKKIVREKFTTVVDDETDTKWGGGGRTTER